MINFLKKFDDKDENLGFFIPQGGVFNESLSSGIKKPKFSHLSSNLFVKFIIWSTYD